MQSFELPEGQIPQDFRPHAIFDVHLDCIRVLTRDTSFCEIRVDPFITVFRDNSPLPGGSHYVGFALKGINHLLNELGLDINASYTLADIVDAIVRHRPASTMAIVLDLYKSNLADDVRESTVDLSTLREAIAA
ncbi:MAG: hypothetical protein AAGK92_00195 [Pseudomonadota bacterium]